jgi:hypothetical protein
MSTIVRTEKRVRSTFGQIVKWIFVAFNLLMLVWLVSGMSAVSQMTADSDAARAGQVIGATIGFSMVLSIWVMGDLILGLLVLLTRGNTVIVEETASGHRNNSWTAHADEGSSDADAMIARYLQRQQAEAAAAPRVPASAAPAGFGRRRR